MYNVIICNYNVSEYSLFATRDYTYAINAYTHTYTYKYTFLKKSDTFLH